MKAFDEHLDPLLWAKRPKSQAAADLIKSGVSSDGRMAEIWQQHIADGICAEGGSLRQRWDGQRFVAVSPTWSDDLQ